MVVGSSEKKLLPLSNPKHPVRSGLLVGGCSSALMRSQRLEAPPLVWDVLESSRKWIPGF